MIEKIVEKAQKANLKTLDKIIDVVFPQVSTSFSSKDLIGIAANALSYQWERHRDSHIVLQIQM